jgi:hypothetical protein
LADGVQVVVAVQPIGVAVSDEAEYRFRAAGFDPDNDHTRQQFLLDRKRDHTGIEVAKRHPPLLCQQLQGAFFRIK